MTTTTSPLIPVIVSGGAGSRLWPLSREGHPKPFIRLADGESLLQKTFRRAAALPGVQRVLTVTNRDFYFQSADEYRAVNAAGLALDFVLEPFGRNTAAAVAAAALRLVDSGPDTPLLVLPADHLISDQTAFAAAVQRATELATQQRLVTFGINPDAPETGYGYIEADGEQVLRFVEKPDSATARNFVDSGRFLWNAGMFCFTPRTVLAELELHAPDIVQALRACLQRARSSSGHGTTQLELDSDSFTKVRDDSIDYALMEKTDCVSVVPCSIGWSDIGSWSALGALLPPDPQGNRSNCDALLLDASDCIVHGDGDRLVAAVGIDGLVIVDTDDALLIVARDRVQDVKKVYAELKSRAHPAYRLHRTVHRPWGTYSVLEEGEQFKIKRIVVKPGASLSLQMHHHRSEHWIVVSGTAKVVNGDAERFVRTNESTYIPACTRHRLLNPGITDLVMIEVQSGSYLGEDDIVRLDDVYGRVRAA